MIRKEGTNPRVRPNKVKNTLGFRSPNAVKGVALEREGKQQRGGEPGMHLGFEIGEK